MTEPATTTTNLTLLSIGLLGPLAGPYALIVISAVAGAMWPLSSATTQTRMDGMWLLLRCASTAIALTGLLAVLAERWWGVATHDTLAPVAFVIGALGNGWRPVFAAIVYVAAAFVRSKTQNPRVKK